MHNDWLFKNNAGYIGETFFCFSSNNCQDLIHYHEIEWIEIIKTRDSKFGFLLIFVQAFMFFLLDFLDLVFFMKMTIAINWILITSLVYYKFPIYKYQIKIFLKDECYIECEIHKDYLSEYYELIEIIKNMKIEPIRHPKTHVFIS